MILFYTKRNEKSSPFCYSALLGRKSAFVNLNGDVVAGVKSVFVQIFSQILDKRRILLYNTIL